MSRFTTYPVGSIAGKTIVMRRILLRDYQLSVLTGVQAQFMSKKPEQCITCGKPPKDGCSRVVCASRKQVTAVPVGSHQPITGGLRKLPTNKE